MTKERIGKSIEKVCEGIPDRVRIRLSKSNQHEGIDWRRYLERIIVFGNSVTMTQRTHLYPYRTQ